MRHERLRYSRRQLLQMLFGGSAMASFSTGCDSLDSWVSGRLPLAGELLSPNRDAGHRLRLPIENRMSDSGQSQKESPIRKCRCVIIGAGAAGLSAAWHLQKQGVEDFRVLELESVPGGTSRSGNRGDFLFPWGAHYLPVPKASNGSLVAFLEDCGVVESVNGQRVTVREDYLCRDPEERVFADGKWRPGLIPFGILSSDDREELDRFQTEMLHWSKRIGTDSKPFFTLPTSQCSEDLEAAALDRISFEQFLSERRFGSPVLKWLVEYSCADDYGLKPDQTSAWAGIFYFAARLDSETNESQEVMTWPEGNAFLVDRLAEPFRDQIEFNQAVMRIASTNDGRYRIDSIDPSTEQHSVIEADHVILAVPQFIAKYLLPRATPDSPTVAQSEATSFSYGSWLVANIHLDQRPNENDFPMAWDNVSMKSSSLGYVNSVHQTGRDHGPTVLTWYTALADDAPEKTRERLMNLSWAEAAESVLSDLETVHPEIRSLVSRLDVMIWGHAMVQPRVGSIFHPGRRAAVRSIGNLHFASTDLSGMALFEEAFDHGRRAAMKVLEKAN